MAVIFRILRTRSHLFTREIFTYPKIAASQRTKVSNSFTESMNDNLPVHDALKPLSWLEGKWTVETPGQGKYPTIESFTYCEKLSFTSIGQPMLNYEAQSWHPIKKNPMHREVGFLRMMPGSENKVVLLLSHNFGLQTIEEGTINDKEIKLESISITRMSEGTKEPSVAKVKNNNNNNNNSNNKKSMKLKFL